MIMLPEGVRGNNRRKEDQLKIMNEIRKLLPIKNDYEIMKILGIPNSTFYRYKSRIYKEDKELLSKKMIEPFESRMLKLMRSLEESYRIFRQIMLVKCTHIITIPQDMIEDWKIIAPLSSSPGCQSHIVVA